MLGVVRGRQKFVNRELIVMLTANNRSNYEAEL